MLPSLIQHTQKNNTMLLLTPNTSIHEFRVMCNEEKVAVNGAMKCEHTMSASSLSADSADVGVRSIDEQRNSSSHSHDSVTQGSSPLSIDFSPSNVDVIVGTGREAKTHVGNKHFLEHLKGFIERYSTAHSKLDKTLIISEIVESVREKSPTRVGFAKKIDTRWYKVGDSLAREKVSQGLRNILHKQYKSSTKAKKQRRNLICKEIDSSIAEQLQTKQSFLSRRISKLSAEIAESEPSDEEIFKMFTQANVDILEGLKQDNTLFQQCVNAAISRPPDGQQDEKAPSSNRQG